MGPPRRLALLMLAGMAAPAAAQEGAFEACVADLGRAAAAAGVPAATIAAATAGLAPDSSVAVPRESQPEFRTPIWDYLAYLVDEERVADGRHRLDEWAPLLAQLERSYRVDRHVIVAVWGVESDYGRLQGTRPLVRSLASAACLGPRRRFFRREFVAALQIAGSGDVALEQLTGSWAGAFGQTQFIPSTFLRLAVDGDGDGRRDLVGSVPDALASTANFLRQGGWRAGRTWGREVRLPPSYRGPSGRSTRRGLDRWAALGIRPVDGSPMRGSEPAALLLPAGPEGPAFLVFRNFDVIFSYNQAESYALAIAHLADRLRGGGGFATPWPTEDRSLSRAERREVQQRLADRGYDVGPVDGVLGNRTRAAIRAFQAEAGLEPDGRAGGRVLDALRATSSQP